MYWFWVWLKFKFTFVLGLVLLYKLHITTRFTHLTYGSGPSNFSPSAGSGDWTGPVIRIHSSTWRQSHVRRRRHYWAEEEEGGGRRGGDGAPPRALSWDHPPTQSSTKSKANISATCHLWVPHRRLLSLLWWLVPGFQPTRPCLPLPPLNVPPSNPKSQIPNSKFQIPNPKSQIPSRLPSPAREKENKGGRLVQSNRVELSFLGCQEAVF